MHLTAAHLEYTRIAIKSKRACYCKMYFNYMQLCIYMTKNSTEDSSVQLYVCVCVCCSDSETVRMWEWCGYLVSYQTENSFGNLIEECRRCRMSRRLSDLTQRNKFKCTRMERATCINIQGCCGIMYEVYFLHSYRLAIAVAIVSFSHHHCGTWTGLHWSATTT